MWCHDIVLSLVPVMRSYWQVDDPKTTRFIVVAVRDSAPRQQLELVNGTGTGASGQIQNHMVYCSRCSPTLALSYSMVCGTSNRNPPYALLEHTWYFPWPTEVLFQTIFSLNNIVRHGTSIHDALSTLIHLMCSGRTARTPPLILILLPFIILAF